MATGTTPPQPEVWRCTCEYQHFYDPSGTSPIIEAPRRLRDKYCPRHGDGVVQAADKPTCGLCDEPVITADSFGLAYATIVRDNDTGRPVPRGANFDGEPRDLEHVEVCRECIEAERTFETIARARTNDGFLVGLEDRIRQGGEDESDFRAFSRARAWLRKKGYGVGATQRDRPVAAFLPPEDGIKRPLVSKWGGLDEGERRNADAVIFFPNGLRNGNAVIRYRRTPHDVTPGANVLEKTIAVEGEEWSDGPDAPDEDEPDTVHVVRHGSTWSEDNPPTALCGEITDCVIAEPLDTYEVHSPDLCDECAQLASVAMEGDEWTRKGAKVQKAATLRQREREALEAAFECGRALEFDDVVSASVRHAYEAAIEDDHRRRVIAALVDAARTAVERSRQGGDRFDPIADDIFDVIQFVLDADKTRAGVAAAIAYLAVFAGSGLARWNREE